MQFPDSLELCQSGYSRNLLGELYQTEFDSFSRRRRKTRSRGVTDTLLWVCNADQYRELSDFHRKAGGQFFSIRLPDWQGLTATTARFNSHLTAKQVGDHVEVSATVFIPSAAVIPNDELDFWLLRLIGITDGTFNDPLYEFVHNRWKDYWLEKNDPSKNFYIEVLE